MHYPISMHIQPFPTCRHIWTHLKKMTFENIVANLEISSRSRLLQIYCLEIIMVKLDYCFIVLAVLCDKSVLCGY